MGNVKDDLFSVVDTGFKGTKDLPELFFGLTVWNYNEFLSDTAFCECG